jgi:hypothetical protein
MYSTDPLAGVPANRLLFGHKVSNFGDLAIGFFRKVANFVDDGKVELGIRKGPKYLHFFFLTGLRPERIGMYFRSRNSGRRFHYGILYDFGELRWIDESLSTFTNREMKNQFEKLYLGVQKLEPSLHLLGRNFCKDMAFNEAELAEKIHHPRMLDHCASSVDAFTALAKLVCWRTAPTADGFFEHLRLVGCFRRGYLSGYQS